MSVRTHHIKHWQSESLVLSPLVHDFIRRGALSSYLIVPHTKPANSIALYNLTIRYQTRGTFNQDTAYSVGGLASYIMPIAPNA
jgi:hypothetical protein